MSRTRDLHQFERKSTELGVKKASIMFAHDSEGSDIDSDTNIDERPNQASSSRDVIDIEKELRALRTGSAFRHQADEIRRESKDAWNRLRSIEEVRMLWCFSERTY